MQSDNQMQLLFILQDIPACLRTHTQTYFHKECRNTLSMYTQVARRGDEACCLRQTRSEINVTTFSCKHQRRWNTFPGYRDEQEVKVYQHSYCDATAHIIQQECRWRKSTNLSHLVLLKQSYHQFNQPEDVCVCRQICVFLPHSTQTTHLRKLKT